MSLVFLNSASSSSRTARLIFRLGTSKELKQDHHLKVGSEDGKFNLLNPRRIFLINVELKPVTTAALPQQFAACTVLVWPAPALGFSDSVGSDSLLKFLVK